MYLIDTNILSELTKRQPDVAVVEFVASLERMAISVITLHEISFGIARSESTKKAKLKQWFEKFLAVGPVVYPIDAVVAQSSGSIRAGSEAKGKQISIADAVIAATAQLNLLVLVTRNTKDFEYCSIPLLNPFSH